MDEYRVYRRHHASGRCPYRAKITIPSTVPDILMLSLYPFNTDLTLRERSACLCTVVYVTYTNKGVNAKCEQRHSYETISNALLLMAHCSYRFPGTPSRPINSSPNPLPGPYTARGLVVSVQLDYHLLQLYLQRFMKYIAASG